MPQKDMPEGRQVKRTRGRGAGLAAYGSRLTGASGAGAGTLKTSVRIAARTSETAIPPLLQQHLGFFRQRRAGDGPAVREAEELPGKVEVTSS